LSESNQKYTQDLGLNVKGLSTKRVYAMQTRLKCLS